MAVEFYRHSLGEEEKAAVASVLDSLFLTTGQRVYEFEKRFEEFLGVPAVVATVHCTASLHPRLFPRPRLCRPRRVLRFLPPCSFLRCCCLFCIDCYV